MKAIPTVTAAALLAAATVAVAQTPTQAPTDPSAASSPHQRQATGQANDSSTSEAPTMNGANPGAASSPHQHETMRNESKAGTEAAMTAGATPQKFVEMAAQDGMAEVGLAKLALKKSSNDEVKQFAQKMEQDHEQANEQLSSIAKSKGLTVPEKLDAKHEAMMKMLSAKSGKAFDQAYAEHMAKDHSKAVALFQGAEQSSDPQLSAFAKKTLPTLEEHKQLADNLNASVGTRTASAAEKDGKAMSK
jgi:putative membrane protein